MNLQFSPPRHFPDFDPLSITDGDSDTSFLLDLVHHNPGELPHSSRFLDPALLADFGYNGQVFKHLNCAIRFDTLYPDLFPNENGAEEWLGSSRARIRKEIRLAKSAGLKIFYHIDLFVLPKTLVERERTLLTDDTGRISIWRKRTEEIHQALFLEMFRDFPEVDGLIIRTGETYLLDTPFHTGNGPIQFHGGDALPPLEEKEIFARLINVLRAEICEKHQRWLIYRTWDTCPDRFHADADYYEEVTRRVEPHPRLIFSIKHTKLDFFRRVPFNAAIGRGQHPQIVEVQCQREYEGKGAHPNYVTAGVIDGFEEDILKSGLSKVRWQAQFRGIFTWSRGGGWYGPYLNNELWCELNTWVLAHWLTQPGRSEVSIFFEYAKRLGMSELSARRFRKLCQLSSRAVLKGRYCCVRDLPLCWMRDQNIGGLEQLRTDLEWLIDKDLLGIALQEKRESVVLWTRMERLASSIHVADEAIADYIKASTKYGRVLYSIVSAGWHVLGNGLLFERGALYESMEIAAWIQRYDDAWREFEGLQSAHSSCATIYSRDYWSWPGNPPAHGMDASVNYFRNVVNRLRAA